MKKTVLTLAAIAAVCGADARTLSPAEALGRAVADREAPAGVQSMRVPRRVDPVLTMQTVDASSPALYVINRDNGFVVVSADDAAAPLLAYSDEGTFDVDNMPENCRWWLGQYAAEISQAIERGEAYEAAAAPARAAIAPKCTTKWNQDAPYNEKCPTVGSTRCFTGCVATAIAQVIKQRSYPAGTGIGTFSYTWNNRTLSFDYGSTTFKWDQMLDSYTSSATAAQRDAVATLMYACGVGSEMSYGTSASGAVSCRVPRMLRENFGFDKGVHFVVRECYSSQAWDDMLYNELSNNGATYYSGRGESGGHAFVADGYLDGFYHFNWGWGGMSDGYFRLNGLTPGSQGIGGNSDGFNDGQGMIIGLKPAEAGSQLAAPYIYSSMPMSAYKNGLFVRVGGYWYNFSPYDVSGKFVLDYYDASTNELVISKTSVNRSLPTATGIQFAEIAASGVPDGTYRAYLSFEMDGVKTPVHTLAYDAGYINIKKSGSTWEFDVPRAGELTTGNLELLSPFYSNKIFGVKLPYSYTASENCLFPVTPILLDPTTNRQVGVAEKMNFILEPGEGALEYSGQWLSYNGSVPAAGNYKMTLTTEGPLTANGGAETIRLCDPVDITIGTISGSTVARINSANWSIENADAVDPADITVKATLNVISGYYAGPVIARVFEATDASYLNPVTDIYSSNVYADKGQHEIVINGEMLGAQPGEVYNMRLYQFNGSTVFTAAAKSFTIGTSAIEDVIADDTEAVYYNLQGARIANPVPGQLVIRKTGDKVEKIIMR